MAKKKRKKKNIFYQLYAHKFPLGLMTFFHPYSHPSIYPSMHMYGQLSCQALLLTLNRFTKIYVLIASIRSLLYCVVFHYVWIAYYVTIATITCNVHTYQYESNNCVCLWCIDSMKVDVSSVVVAVAVVFVFLFIQ